MKLNLYCEDKMNGLSALERCLCIFGLLLFFPLSIFGKSRLPDWLTNAMSSTLVESVQSADSVVLRDDCRFVYDNSGAYKMYSQYAIKILTKNGMDNACGLVYYNIKTERIKDLKAWLILPDGNVKKYKSKDFENYESSDDCSLYSDLWVSSLNVSEGLPIGAVFAYSYCLTGKDIFSQFKWETSDTSSINIKELHISVPDGWSIKVAPINNPVYTEDIASSTYTWTVQNCPAVKTEKYGLRGTQYSYLGISIFPSDADQVKAQMQTFDCWQRVAAFQTDANDPSVVTDGDMEAAVRELTVNCDTWTKRLQAICRYVQAVKYVSLACNIAEGGGYKPDVATKVFSKNYGDCKNKTALLRAMLKCIGVKSYSVACRLGSDVGIDPAWPSLANFNHCIIAIEAPEDVDFPSVIQHPELGRLILFDPTNIFVPVGYVPSSLSGTNCLVGSPECTALSLFPIQTSCKKSEVTAALDELGKLDGTLVQSAMGSSCEWQLKIYKASTATDYKRFLQERIKNQTREASLKDSHVEDRFDDDLFEVRLVFTAPDYARHLGADRLLFSLFVNDSPYEVPDSTKRKTRFHVSDNTIHLTSTIEFPDSFSVEELPKDVCEKNQFGEVSLHCESDGNRIIADLTMQQKDNILEPDLFQQYRLFRKLFNKALRTSVVIRRNP